jgi:hypothetical protein
MPVLVVAAVSLPCAGFLPRCSKQETIPKPPWRAEKVGSVPLHSQVANNDVALRAVLDSPSRPPTSRPPNPPQHPRRYCSYSALLYSESYWLKEIPNSYHSLCAVPFISKNDHSLNGYLRRPSCDVTKVEILFGRGGQSAILQSLKKDTWLSQWYVRPSFQNQFYTILCFMGNTLFRLVYSLFYLKKFYLTHWTRM